MADSSWEGRWQRPEKGVWAILCGLPDAQARRKPLLMLRLYIDDSGKPDHSPVQVLAGYLSTGERWAAFSNEWQRLLDGAGLDAFRMADAWRFAKRYRGRGQLRRDHLIVRLIECIKAHVEIAFVSCVPFEGHSYWFNPTEDESPALRPYFFGFYSVLSNAYRYAFHRRADQRLELIFDKQGGESEAYVLSAMDGFRRRASQEFCDLVIPTPTFQSDKDALPLQAADLLAWLFRRDAHNATRGIDRSKSLERILLTEALSMSNRVFIWTEERLRIYSELMANDLLSKYPDLADASE